MRILYSTYKITIINKTDEDLNSPSVITFWHGKMWVFIPFLGKKGVVALVSHSEDGEMISNLLKYFKYKLVRGSTSRGGSKALVKMIKNLKKGDIVAITPDGPKGPSRIFQKGALYLSAKAKVPIIPMNFISSNSYSFSSWDKFEIPYPFAKIKIIIGKKIIIDNKLDNKKIEKYSETIKNIMDSLEYE
jgi:lysophospholipid acyltransferase (LPLAT)-like uncharacterized protein